jgi:hypothetical protein
MLISLKFVYGGAVDINVFDYRMKIIDLKVEIGLLVCTSSLGHNK